MSATTHTLRSTDRQLIAVQALFAERRYQRRGRRSKAARIGSGKRVTQSR
jgi:hypothetical protein